MTAYVPQTHVSFMAHDIEHMQARASRAAHTYAIQVDATAANGRRVVDFTLFIDDADVAFDLAAAINGVFASRKKHAA